jgi:hydrogenase nickel incorporation protein HypA/HybF
MAGIDKGALLFSYDLARQETPLAESRLVIEDVDVAILCPVCNGERPSRTSPLLTCAECGAICNEVVRGDELEIRAMEVIT